nr:YfhO family protein [Bacilli bacterium]
ILVLFAFCIGAILITIKDTYALASKEALLINVIILFLYVFFFLLGKYFKTYRNIFFFALILVTSIDCIESLNYGLQVSQIADNFYSSTKEIDESISTIKNYDNSLFYRIENPNNHTLNDSAKSFYNGVTTFSSMAYQDMAELQRYLGNQGNNINSYMYVDQTPIYDMMFNVKYMIGSRIDNQRYELIKPNSNITKFNYSLGLAFGVNKDVLNWEYTNNNPVYVQNDFVEKATHIDNVFNPLTLVDEEEIQNDTLKVIKYTYLNPKEISYIYWNTSSISFIKIGNDLYARDDYYTNCYYLDSYNYNNYNDEHIVGFSSEEDYIEILIGYNYYTDNIIHPYYLDSNKFEQVYNNLKNNTLTLTTFEEDKIVGQVYLDDDSVMYTSIPYDEGWNVYVNDMKVNTYSLGNSLLAFDVSKGLNKIEFRYRIPKLKIGLIISTISLAIIFQLFYIEKKKKVTRK